MHYNMQEEKLYTVQTLEPVYYEYTFTGDHKPTLLKCGTQVAEEGMTLLEAAVKVRGQVRYRSNLPIIQGLGFNWQDKVPYAVEGRWPDYKITTVFKKPECVIIDNKGRNVGSQVLIETLVNAPRSGRSIYGRYWHRGPKRKTVGYTHGYRKALIGVQKDWLSSDDQDLEGADCITADLKIKGRTVSRDPDHWDVNHCRGQRQGWKVKRKTQYRVKEY
jgi:hypothetical protein